MKIVTWFKKEGLTTLYFNNIVFWEHQLKIEAFELIARHQNILSLKTGCLYDHSSLFVDFTIVNFPTR